MYREKGIGTGKKAFDVPGTKHFPKESNKYLSQVNNYLYQCKGTPYLLRAHSQRFHIWGKGEGVIKPVQRDSIFIKRTFSKISPSFRCWENNVVVTSRMFHIVCLYPAIFALFAGRSVYGDFLSFSIIFHKRVARERCDAIFAQFT